MANKLMTLVNVIVSILVAVALVSYGTAYWFDFNIIEFITFGVGWLMGTVYTIVAIVGTIWVLSALGQLLLKK